MNDVPASDPNFLRAQARVGSILSGKWVLDRLLGVGGMAAVYAATHRNSKRAAIKIMHPELSIHPEVRERFLREGYAANQVKHQGVVTVHDDAIADDGSAYLVMDLLDGETLDAYVLRHGGVLSAEKVLSVLDPVLDTLIAAHERGIVHRDLKPENIFIESSASVRVLDFGIARVASYKSASTTESGVLLGTPAFMAPEQARGTWDEVDAQSDLWSLGATMFTLLTGRFVHRAATPNELVAFAMTRPSEPLASVLPGVDPVIAQLVDRAVAFHKPDRFRSAREMQRAVRRAHMEMTTGASPADSREIVSAVPTLISARDAAPHLADSVVRAFSLSRQAVTRSGRPVRPPRKVTRLAGGLLTGSGLILVIAFSFGRPGDSGKAKNEASVSPTPHAASVGMSAGPNEGMSTEVGSIATDARREVAHPPALNPDPGAAIRHATGEAQTVNASAVARGTASSASTRSEPTRAEPRAREQTGNKKERSPAAVVPAKPTGPTAPVPSPTPAFDPFAKRL